MGVLSDLYLAEPKRAKDYDESQECAEDDRAQYKGITPLELSTLLAIIRGKDRNVAMMNEFPEIMIVNEGERVIFEIPHSAMTCFAALPESEFQVAAEAWSKTDELRCSAEDVRPVIEDIVRLSKRGQETNRLLFLWICI